MTKPPDKAKDSAGTESLETDVSARHDANSTQIRATSEPLPYRRNRHRGGVCSASTRSGTPQAAGAGRGSVRAAWVDWLAPVFADTDSAYFTGTYSDDYGIPNGLMLSRNVHKDVLRFLDREIHADFARRPFICGVEKHLYRDVLHWHGIIQGPFTQDELAYLKGMWAATRGHARVLPVTDGCASYVTKYALKGDTDSFEWRLR